MDSSTTQPEKQNGRQKSKSGHVPISSRYLDSIKPSPENFQLYRPIDTTDAEFRDLVESVKRYGIKEPLVITRDGWIVSGHRRHAAAKEAGLTVVPCRVEPIRKDADHDQFMQLLRECNRQRVKTHAELLREAIVTADPEEAYQVLIGYRAAQSAVDDTGAIKLRGAESRAAITRAKEPFLAAVKSVIESRKRFWPLSDRQIHYPLLNDPPLIHASKPNSRYTNTIQSYKALVDLLTRARIAGIIPMNVIADETRPVCTWDVHDSVASFFGAEMDSLFKGYWRDLMQSQPNHIEIVAEKNTVLPIVRPVAAQFCIPLTISRGFSSLPPRYGIAQRFEKSGKDRLILIVVTDFDPDGEEIAHSLVRSLRDDFSIGNITAIKAGLTAEQVDQFKLTPMMKAKTGSRNHKRFVDKYGDNVFELEALPPETLQAVLRATIDRVIDAESFNFELAAEKADAAFLCSVRGTVFTALSDIIDDLDMEGDA